MEDKVNHPKHYNNSKANCTHCSKQIECIEVTRHMGFNIGNVIKYLWRFQDKNGLEDLKKAQWYLNDMITSIEREKAQRTVVTAAYQHCSTPIPESKL